MFDLNERKIIEKFGLNCIFIDESNKDKKYRELDYFDHSLFEQNTNVKNTYLFDIELFKSFDIIPFGFPILIIDPRFWNNIYIDINQKYNIESLVISTYMTALLKKPTILPTILSSLDFLKYFKSLKQFYLQPQKNILFTDFWDIKDFTSLEYLSNLEDLSISNDETVVNIDFAKLKQLKKVNLQYPRENKTLYECTNLESIDTRYYEKDLTSLSKLQKLNFLSAYCDNLESFEGIKKLSSLKDFKIETTSKMKEFKNLQSDTIKTFYLYTEEASKLKSLDGIEGLTSIENIAFNGYKKLESINSLSKCHTLKIITFENCKIPNDIYLLSELKNLEKVTLDDCKDIQSLKFVEKLSNLKYLSFDNNTNILDGDLKFLKELNKKGVEIHFNDRKHYNIKYKEIENK
ncbi:hypothetical protein BN3087_960002 [Sulfurovum sp. enrichment culture clone C5]|uniref:Uncharacterized protein n=1 Tax=Sulfurovum sp. enrichment culture clone C5 TaxID=497650 RepID=A0A0S4XQN8_9BACT|nr:hypothetical protein BN3087_960002 [Sulfurovum sp. enrichment culture clone C5]